jgi:hypothetical protein
MEPDNVGAAPCDSCEALRGEVVRLGSEIAKLRARNEELARQLINRDYERPPHYL